MPFFWLLYASEDRWRELDSNHAADYNQNEHEKCDTLYGCYIRSDVPHSANDVVS